MAVPARTATPVGPPKAGDIRRDSKTGLSYAFLPGGTFLMGCASGDSRCFDNESAHNQAVDALWMNVTDVTVAAYTRCVEAGSCTAAKTDFASCNYGRRPNHPINCVSWEQASSFCGWAGGRLPTAAEWEYAAKNGRDVVYPWGNEPVNGRRTNYCDVNCAKEIPADLVEQWKKDGWLDASQDDGWSATSPVGSYPAGDTPWGLKDMAGNAVQWTASHFDANNIEVRGGSWGSNAPALRSSFREKIAPDGGSYTVGFRCVQ